MGSAVVTSVYTKEGWKIYAMHTVAESLKQFPEVSPYDGHMTGAISWETQRRLENDTADPEVLIVGGGQKSVHKPIASTPTNITQRACFISALQSSGYEDFDH